LLWAIPWSVLLGLGVTVTVLLLGVRIGALSALGQGMATGFSWGLAAGALFASALMLAEQQRGFAGLTRTRGAIWGGLAGIWFPALIGIAFGPKVLPWISGAWPAWLGAAVMGAVSGLATVWLAGRGAGTFPRSMEPDPALSDPLVSASLSDPRPHGSVKEAGHLGA
ncbi:MAG TPA: hypothetical protein VLD58_09660, partial [Gemmatimonadales bacterium]|nr:hypothetical protein [Gemmatimonadales bacterium]